jgi:hypothetical protein
MEISWTQQPRHAGGFLGKQPNNGAREPRMPKGWEQMTPVRNSIHFGQKSIH